MLRKVAEIEGGLGGGPVEFAPWHAYQRWLAAGERRVIVPYAEMLASHPNLYDMGVRMRRDFHQLLSAIKAHALLNREHRKRDDNDRIVATIRDDYDAAHELLADRLAQGAGTKLKKNDFRVLNAVKTAQADIGSNEGVKVQTLVKELHLDQTTVNRRLTKLTALGFLENLTPGKGRTSNYRANGQPANLEVLPSVSELLKAWREKL